MNLETLMIRNLASSASRKLEAADISDEQLDKIVNSIPPLPESYAQKLITFKKEVGEEIFAQVAAGQSLNSVLDKWIEDIKTQNSKKIVKTLMERVPGLEEDEIHAMFSLTK